MESNSWVDARMSSLEPASGWQPDASRALGKLRQRRRAVQVRRRNWFYVAGAAAASLLVLGLVEPRACAKPRGCDSSETQTASPKAAMPAAAAPATAQTPTDFKQSGNPRAPITCEIYSDYECPHCAVFYKETLPQLMAEYVKTGKVKIVHRDFPLPQHPSARLAARYANAAGSIGRYDVVVDRLFRTQEVWSVGGDVAGALAQTLTPTEMKTVQRMVESDVHLDDSVAVDIAAAQKDQIHSTPSLVIAAKGKRQTITPIPNFQLLKSYLDSLAQ